MSMKTMIAAMLVLSATALPAVAADTANDASGATARVEQRPLFAGAATADGFSVSLHQAQVLGHRQIEERVDARDPALTSPMLRGVLKETGGGAVATVPTSSVAGS
jgi:hypothetical protein